MSTREHVEEVRGALLGHVASSASEERSRRRTLSYLDWLASPMDEFADPTHVTASAVVMSMEATPRIVLHRHKRLGRWLQPGGHVDAGESVPAAAIREVLEETGLIVEHVDATPHLVHIDVHQGPRGHVHLDTRWLVLARADDAFLPAEDESPDVGWFSPAEARRVSDQGLVEAIDTSLRLLTGPEHPVGQA